MKNKRMLFVAALLFSMASASWAKDAVETSVTNWTGSPFVQINGNPYAQGTFAVGTIQLSYTVTGYTFTAGSFGSFDVGWDIEPNLTSGGTTNYTGGITLNFQEIGGTNLVLTPNPGSFTVLSSAQTGTSNVAVSIANNVPSDPALNCDGCELVGHLQLSTTPQGAKLDTPTDILVKIKLVHPTACIKVYNFVTDQDYQLGTLQTTNLKVATNGAHAGKVVSSQPDQYSDNVLIANTCSTDASFDLKLGLDPNFETNPSGNVGMAVFTYAAPGEIDASNFNITTFGSGTPQGQQLCLQNVTVTAGTTFLATVHSQVKKGTAASALPSDGSFDFAASLSTANSGCSTGLISVANPNPATFVLPFTTN